MGLLLPPAPTPCCWVGLLVGTCWAVIIPPVICPTPACIPAGLGPDMPGGMPGTLPAPIGMPGGRPDMFGVMPCWLC